ncbi:MAG TPA: hypothetical protein EYP73_05065 [Acidimicrobiia bacterium]|nr:hypothetical protein [Acidimicrobiia bacterium]
MATTTPEVRRIPLRVAGVIGLASAVVYLIVILGETDSPLLTLAIFWLVVMIGSGLLAWYAVEAERGRMMARLAAGGFFLVGLFSNPVFAVVFLVAVVLCIVGSARLEGVQGRP